MDIYPVPGIRLGCTSAGIRYRDRDDLLLMTCADGATGAAVFTRNRFCAAPVLVARQHLHVSQPRALLINAGNANAGTGDAGMQDALASCQAVADAVGCHPEQVLPYSTGVIGTRLPVQRLIDGIGPCIAHAAEDVAAWQRAARAIMTTDTVAKIASTRCRVGDTSVTITGFAKGAGMIRPDMATMLAFVASDVVAEPGVLQQALEAAVAVSFNRITVDGDTSTNDACTLLATGSAAMPTLGRQGPEYEQFLAALADVLQQLAKSIIRDAEGATKFITINVSGGSREADNLSVAYTVAESPLVKTAMFASDPNWGRILAAIGRARVDSLDIADVDISINATPIITAGQPNPSYSEAAGQAAMASGDIVVDIRIGKVAGGVTVWTSDLSDEYVRINAEYRT